MEEIANMLSQADFRTIAISVGILMLLNSWIMIPPSEYICIGAGIACAKSGYNIGIVILIASTTNFLGTYYWYLLGRRHHTAACISQTKISNGVVNRFFNFYVRNFPAMESFFRKRGAWGVFFLRLVPLIRSIASYPAGRNMMHHGKFVAASILGICTWVSTWTAIGYRVGISATQYTLVIGGLLGLTSIALYRLLVPIIQKHK